ncbi:MAG: nucleotidyl transferase AbiEii/AbiGii toxin family protein [Deltaproteobacteria bacterium]|nr:nucleotidyl transferase AbiEii/AbiGii toxin family protein [Deltaproteobacteria bacterium]
MELAGAWSLSAGVVEKDYVLGWLLAGIQNQAELATEWVFKGGTCLKKCFFETYRFSEDLDFTVRSGFVFDETRLKTVLERVGAWVYDQTGIEIPTTDTRVGSRVGQHAGPSVAKPSSYGPILEGTGCRVPLAAWAGLQTGPQAHRHCSRGPPRFHR